MEEEIEIKDEKCEYFINDYDDNFEVIEVKMEDDDEIGDFYDENFDDQLVDIANIPVSEDVPSELIIADSSNDEIDQQKERTLDNQELAILEKDLKTTTPGYEHLAE